MKPRVVPSLVLLLSLLPVGSFPAWPQPQPEAPAPPQVEEAVRKYQARDLPGAIALLEPLRGQPDPHPAVRVLLGTLYLEAGRPQDSLALLRPLAEAPEAGPVILYTAGRAAIAAGRADQALSFLQRAADKAPDSPASRALGILLGSQGKLAESYRYLRPWALAHPDDQESRLSAAYSAVELDRTPEAEELLQGLPDDNPRVRLLRGRLFLLRHNPQQALAALGPLAQGAPPELELSIRRYLAEAHLALGQSAEAIALVKGRAGDNPSLALVLGRAYYRAGDPASAAATLEPFTRRFLSDERLMRAEQRFAADLALEYGQALVALARWADAIPPLEQAARLAPESLQAWQLLGRAQLAAGRRDEATLAMEKFRQLQAGQQPNSERISEMDRAEADPTGRNLQQALNLFSSGQPAEALAMVRREIGFVPKDPRPRVLEATLLLKGKGAGEALQAAEASLAVLPGDADLLYLRGAARMALGRTQEAEQDFRQVLQAQPAHVGTLNDLAVLLIASGRKDEARPLLHKVLEIQPGNPMAEASLKSLQ